MINKKKYHHGKLKEAIIFEVTKQLKTQSFEKISFRSIARNIGVASSAPYNHFESKEKLLTELIQIGKLDLFHKIEIAKNNGKNSTEKLLLIAKAYLKFSIEKKDIFELMFNKNNVEYDRLCNQMIIVFEKIVITKLEEKNRKRVTSQGAAITAWSMIYGFSIMMNKRIFTNSKIEKLIDFEVQKVFNEMAAIWGKGVS